MYGLQYTACGEDWERGIVKFQNGFGIEPGATGKALNKGEILAIKKSSPLSISEFPYKKSFPVGEGPPIFMPGF